MDGFLQKPEGWEEIDYRVIHDLLVDTNELVVFLPPTPELLEKLNIYDQPIIMVLAGGLNEYAQNHQWVTRRLDLAVALYRQKPRTIICLGGGTYHKPPYLNSHGFVIHESTACIQYLIDRGVDPRDLMREWSSYDTIANAFFSYLNFVIPLKLSRILVITSDFHMPRTKAIFTWIYSLKNSNSNNIPEQQPAIEFLSVNSRDLDDDIIKARLEREKHSLMNLQDKIKHITTLEEFHNWFYTEHKAYNCDFDHLKGCSVNNTLDPSVKNSY